MKTTNEYSETENGAYTNHAAQQPDGTYKVFDDDCDSETFTEEEFSRLLQADLIFHNGFDRYQIMGSNHFSELRAFLAGDEFQFRA